MTLEEFEGIVNQTVKDLPEEFNKQIDNVSILVDIWPTEDEMKSIKAHPGSLLRSKRFTSLFGLYQGIPKTKRTSSYQALPDKIIIYAGPILMVSKDLEDAKRRIKDTVLHEIGHHFGMSEEKIRAAENKLM